MSHKNDLVSAVSNVIPFNVMENISPDLLLQHVKLVESQEPQKILLESSKRLSQSMLWKIQEEFYATQGIDAWAESVPFFITNSIYIAESYAEMMVHFLRDYRPYLNADEPVYFIEMATGLGRFSYYFLKELMAKLECFSELKDLKLRYIMTDFTENNIEYWEKHENFQPYIQQGILDFAVFRPAEFQSLDLRISGVKLTKNNIHNPLIAIGNYFFDSIKQDIFRVMNKSLDEGRVNLYRDMAGIDPDSPVKLNQVEVEWSYHPATDRYYQNPKLNKLLRWYRENSTQSSIIMPVGAFDCIRNLEVLSNNNLILISSDKGFTHKGYMDGLGNYTYQAHDGCFSYMVNYHAIGKYFENEGGYAFTSQGDSLHLQTVFCIDTPHNQACKFESLNYYFKHRVNRNNPINFVFDVKDYVIGDSQNRPNDTIFGLMSYIRLALGDPNTFVQCAPALLRVLPHITYSQKVDLFKLMEEVWQNFYFFRGEVNLPFWMSQIYYNLEEYQHCIDKTQAAIEYFGPHEALYFFIGASHEALQNYQQATAAYEEALKLKPDFAEAQEGLQKVKSAA